MNEKNYASKNKNNQRKLNNKKIDKYKSEPLSFLQIFICIFIVIMPLLFCKWNDQSPFEMIKAYFSTFFVSIMFAIYLVSLILKETISIRFNKWIFGLSIYLFIYMLSFAFSGHIYSSLWGVLNLPAGSVMTILTFVILSFLVVQEFRDNNSLKKLIFCFIFTAFLMSIYGIIQHFGGDPINWWVYTEMTTRALSTMGQSVGYGTVLGCCLPICFAYALTTDHLKKFIAWSVVWLSLNIGILYSGSRIPIVGYFITLSIFIVFLVLFRRKISFLSWKKVSILIGFVIMANLIYFLEPGENALSKKLESSQLKRGYVARFEVWKTAFKLWEKYPVLGVGPENFGEEFNHIQTVEQNYNESWNLIWHKAHNEFIHYLATTGALGFSAYLLLIILMFVPVFQYLRRNEWESSYLFSIGLLGGFGYLLVTHMTAFSFIPTLMIFYIFPAMNYNFSGLSREFVFENKLNRNWKMFLSTVVIVIGTLSCYNVYQVWQADIDYNESRRQLVSYGNIEKSHDFLVSAINQNPRNAEYWCFRSDVYYNLFVRSLRAQGSNIEQQRKNFYDEIINSSDRCVTLDPRKSDLWRARGTLFLTLTQFFPQLIEVSFEAYKKAIEVYPNNPYNHISLASVFIKKGRLDLAVESLKTAISKRNDVIPAYIELLKIYYQTGVRSEITTLLNDVKKYVTKQSEFYYQLPNLIKVAEDNKDNETVLILRSL